MAKVTVEFSGKIELDNVQGWGDDTKLEQVKKQAADEVAHWQIYVRKGAEDPVPVNFIKMKVTEVTIPIKKD